MDAATQAAGPEGQDAEQQKLKIDKFADGQIICLKFAGTVDEDFDGKKLASTVKAKTLVLDLAEIRKISSFGIREWVDFINLVQKNSEEIILLECAPKVVDQLNMVANFAGNGRVFSFYAPYRCDYCDTDTSALMQVDRDWEVIKSMKPPERPCGACGEPEYFDEDPTTYFSFIAAQDKFELDPEVGAFLSSKLNYTVSESARRLRIDKIIEGRSTYLKMAGDLDGSFPREKLAEGLEGTIIIDVTGMGKIDPAGAAEWRGFLQMITPTAEAIFLLGVPPGFLEKLTKPEDLGPKAQVVTFAMPYSCAKCATTASQVIDVEQHYDVLKFATPPEMKCKDCKNPTTCAATEGLLSHLPTLPKPGISPQTRKFIKEVRERKPEKKKAATTVAEAAAQGRGSSAMMMFAAAAIAAALAVGGVLGYRYMEERKKKAAVAKRDAVGALVNQKAEARPEWITSDTRFNAYCTNTDDALTCVGVSSYADNEETAREEAQEAGLEAVVNAVGLQIEDTDWRENVGKIFGDERQSKLGAFQNAREDPDDNKYKKSRKAVREGRKAVAAAFAATAAGLVPTAATDDYWEEYAAGSGDGSRYLYFIEYAVPAAQVQRIIDNYSKAHEALGASAVTAFPGIAWRWPEITEGAVITKLESDSNLKSIGLDVQFVVTEVQKRSVADGAAFASILGKEMELLKKEGGNLDMMVKSGDTPLRKYSNPVQRMIKETPRPTGTGGHRPTNTGGSGTVNTWDRHNQGKSNPWD